jgi:hypothetical protein
MPDTPKPLGRVPSPEDPRDFSILALLGPDAAAEAITLPTSYRISTAMYVGRFNQQENSCVGHSGAFAKIIHERRSGLARYYAIEPLWLWDRSKQRDGIGSPTADRGTYIRTMLDVLVEMGATLSRTDQSAEPRFKIAAYYRADTIYQIKAALYKTASPVIVGSMWFDSWFTPGKYGMLPSPDNEAGGHAYCAIGYSNGIACPDGSKGALRCANSWGEDWGDRGDFWLPYTMFGADKPADEAWKLEDVAA